MATKPKSAIHTAHAADMEYSVYIYHRPTNENNKSHTWERRAVTNDLRMAKLKAKCLHESQRYEKVELQKTTFYPREQSRHNKIVKIYDDTLSFNERLQQVMLVMTGFLGVLGLVAGIFALV